MKCSIRAIRGDVCDCKELTRLDHLSTKFRQTGKTQSSYASGSKKIDFMQANFSPDMFGILKVRLRFRPSI